MTIGCVFVYGSLKPGFSRWPALEEFVDCRRTPTSDEIEGQLWDTTRGWPAMTDGVGHIKGFLVRLRPERVDAALCRLDWIEGVDAGLFERAQVTTESGSVAWDVPLGRGGRWLCPPRR